MEKVKLTDICNPKQWKTLSMNELKEDGKYFVYGANGIIGYYDQYNHEKETVLITCRGATCGNVHISKEKSYINGNAMSLDKLKEEICLRKYLYYFLKQYDMKKIISGSAQPQITVQNLSKINIKVVDRIQQIKIVKILDNVQEIIDIRKKQIEELNELIKSKFIEMFGNVKNEVYNTKKIRDLVDTNIEKLKKKFFQNDIIRYVDISAIDNIKNEIIGYTEYKVGEEPSRAQQCLKKGDILIATVRPNLRNIAVNKYEESNVIGSSGFCVLRPKECNLEYLLNVVKTDEFTNDMVSVTTGANYPAIRLSDILDYEVSVPPLELQNQFADIVKQIEEQKEKIQKSLEEMKKLQESLMNKYFG